MQQRREYDSEDEGSGMEDEELEDMETSDLAVGIVPDLSLPTAEANTQPSINAIEYALMMSSCR